MIQLGFRQAFKTQDQAKERYSNLLYPIELALPWRWEDYAKIRKYLPRIAEDIREQGPDVLSVHAVQAPITDIKFRLWGTEIAKFCDIVGAGYVTIHPNKVEGGYEAKEKSQKDVLRHLDYLHTYTKTRFVIESFEGRKRVFTTHDLMKFKLPMVLDTSHVFRNDKIFRTLALYKENIHTIHMSAKDGPHIHQRIDDFCIEVIKYLRDSKWSGNIILEYLWPLHKFFEEDIVKIRGVLDV